MRLLPSCPTSEKFAARPGSVAKEQHRKGATLRSNINDAAAETHGHFDAVTGEGSGRRSLRISALTDRSPAIRLSLCPNLQQLKRATFMNSSSASPSRSRMSKEKTMMFQRRPLGPYAKP